MDLTAYEIVVAQRALKPRQTHPFESLRAFQLDIFLSPQHAVLRSLSLGEISTLDFPCIALCQVHESPTEKLSASTPTQN